MRVSLDAIVLHDRKTWTGRLAHLFRALADDAPGDSFVLLENFLRARPDAVGRPNVRRAPVRLPRGLLAAALRRLPFEVFTGPVDVHHAFTLYLPRRRRCRLIATAYDLAYLRRPEAFPEAERARLAVAVPAALRGADVVAAISAFTAREVVEVFGLPPERVVAAPLGVGPAFAPPPASRIAAVRARHGLDRPYVLSVGTLEPRKNLPRLLEAFRLLDERRLFDGDLALAGAPGWGPVDIPSGIASRVRRLGWVPDADLPALYAGAEAFAYVSLYEGFGIPVLEAMACGAVVVTSRGTACEEVAAGAAVLVEPTDVEEMAGGLARALLDEDLRADLRRRARARAAEMSWPAAARRLLSLYRSL